LRRRSPRLCVRFAESASAMALAVVLICAVLTPLACWGGKDTNEPNNDLQQATELTSGRPVAGVIGLIARPADIDIFSSEAPQPGGASRFLVEVRCARPADLKVQVGASIPGAPEGISWPGWTPRVEKGVILFDAALAKGTLLVLVSGKRGTDYSLTVTWQ
jgi:hypothetical protein